MRTKLSFKETLHEFVANPACVSVPARHTKRGTGNRVAGTGNNSLEASDLSRKKTDRFCIYVSPPEPCWYVEVPWDDGKDGVMLRSSRVIVIGRRTGVIHYDGSAGDEG